MTQLERAGAPGRVAVIGDVAGHAGPLLRVLADLGVGVDPYLAGPDGLHGVPLAGIDLAWPDDLHVVSVGDLVHRGPDSEGVVALVDRLAHDGRWTPVLGNHEQLYVDAPRFYWSERVSAYTQHTLWDWWHDGLMVPAAAITSPDGADGAVRDRLVTHAGLTSGFWAAVGSPETAAEAADAIAGCGNLLWDAGVMLGHRTRADAGPVWAEAGLEVALSWLALAVGSGISSPFDQFHGHTSLMRWDAGELWHPDLGPILDVHGADLIVDHASLHTHLHLGEQTITGVDPGHDKQVRLPWKAAVMHGTVATRTTGA